MGEKFDFVAQFKKFQEDTKESVQILLDKYNEYLDKVDNLSEKVEEFKNFLLYNSRKYRKFINRIKHDKKF